MNQVSREFLELAKRSVVEYIVNDDVLAIIVAGSVARGTADRNSDVDTLLFLERPFPQDLFESECRRAVDSGGCVYGGSPEEGFALYRYIDGVRCDFVFDLKSTMDRRLSQVLDDYNTDEQKQLMIRSVRESVLLYGEDLVGRWRRRSDQYPDGLAEAVIRENLSPTPRWVLEKMGAERGEKLFLYDCLMYNVKRLFAVLFGLNRQYHPAKLKGIQRVAAALRWAPHDFYRRTESLFGMPLAQSVNEFAKLVDEVYQLVDEHMGQIDTTRSRKIFRMKLAIDSRFKS